MTQKGDISPPAASLSSATGGFEMLEDPILGVTIIDEEPATPPLVLEDAARPGAARPAAENLAAPSETEDFILALWSDISPPTPSPDAQPGSGIAMVATEVAASLVDAATDMNQRVSNWFHVAFNSSAPPHSMSIAGDEEEDVVIVSAGDDLDEEDALTPLYFDDKDSTVVISMDSSSTSGSSQPSPPEVEHTSSEAVISTPTSTSSGSAASSIWILGRSYQRHETQPPSAHVAVGVAREIPRGCRRDVVSRIHCTYRTHFPEPLSTVVSAQTSDDAKKSWWTDVGWGCMLRTGQSLLAQALLHRHLGRDWRLKKDRANWWPAHSKVLAWFADTYSAPFSLHSIATRGAVKYGKPVGEWFGPHTISSVIQDLVNESQEFGIRACISSDGTVYRDNVLHTAKSSSESSFQPVLLLVVVRLGVHSLNSVYYPALKACLAFPQCVGIAGGRPDASLYFIGFEGDQLYYLDPHQSQRAIKAKPSTLYSSSDAATYHTAGVRKISISKLDPCMLIGFLLSSEADVQSFFTMAAQVSKLGTSAFEVSEKAPVYRDDLDFGKVSDAEWA